MNSDNFKKITNGMSDFQKISMKIAQAMKSVIESGKVFQGIIGSISETFNSSKEFLDELTKIGKLIARFGTIIDLFSLIMIEIDWPPPLKISPKSMHKIIEIYQKNGVTKAKEYSNTLLLKLYDKKLLIDLLKSWESKVWLDKRITILENVIDAHNEEKFILSIPAMLPQIEGIIVDGYNHKGWFDERKLRKYIDKLYKDGVKNFSVDEVIRTFLLKTVWAKFQHGTKTGSSFSRHAILHGADTKYGTAENSLKVILLFDYFSFLPYMMV